MELIDTLLRLQINGNRSFACTLSQIRGAHTSPGGRAICTATVPYSIAFCRRFDLDDISAKETQIIGAGRPRQNMGKIDHQQSREGGFFRHIASLFRSKSEVDLRILKKSGL